MLFSDLSGVTCPIDRRPRHRQQGWLLRRKPHPLKQFRRSGDGAREVFIGMGNGCADRRASGQVKDVIRRSTIAQQLLQIARMNPSIQPALHPPRLRLCCWPGTMTDTHHGVALTGKPGGKMATDKAAASCDPDDFRDAVTTEGGVLVQRMLPKELAAAESG